MKNLPQHERRELEKLRKLLVGPELVKLDQLSNRLENREVFTSDIGEVLPQAMIKSAQQGEQLSVAMMPTVEEIVRLSVKRDINIFAEALFPVIGPAIRKSITETIRQMVFSMSQIIDNSFSWQGIKWRIESLRTGVSFSKIVMLHSLEYEVEQVFLIHQHTGLLLSHVKTESTDNQNADMVSSMLTAIDDFVNDSFTSAAEQNLASIEVGDILIWLDKSPNVILALAIRGNAPASLRLTMHETLEQIEALYSAQLLEFKGDVSVFDATQTLLNDCLQAHYQPAAKKKSSIGLWGVGAVLVALLIYWFAASLYQSNLYDNYLVRLESEPGYTITGSNDAGGILQIRGLRDPLSRSPVEVLQDSSLEGEAVDHQFEFYQSFEDSMVLARVTKMISPPLNVNISVEQGRLRLKGFASRDWVDSIDTKLVLTTGVTAIDKDTLSNRVDLTALAFPQSVKYQFDIDSGLLGVEGDATGDWRDNTRELVTTITGIRSYDDSRLSSSEALALKSDIELLQNRQVYFDQATSFNFDANKDLDEIIVIVQRIIANAKILSKNPKITIWGFSDSVGSFEDNKLLSFERADYVSQYLFLTGISPRYIEIKGLQKPVERETSAEQRRLNRRVEFTVQID